MNSSAIPPQPESPQPPCLTVRLLGDFTLHDGAEAITQINTPRLQALLTYLLLHRQASQSRRHLAFLFWPDSTEAQALTNLRKQLLYLRQVLPHCDKLLVTDRYHVHWVSDAAISLDVETFRAALATAAQAADSQAIAALRTAVTCYRGELLPGCYDEWIFAEREALHTQYGHALERLSSLLETQRNYTEAITYSEQLLRHDPLHEPTYRRLMRLHALNGDRPAALRVYHTGLTQLRDELGIDPDEETQAVYERLLQGAAVTTAQPELAAYAPFVSRQAEWQTLQQRWRLAQSGQPQLVLIAGEAGIGKTRLAEELLHWATHQGFCTARARCYAAEGRLTYAPVIEWLRTERLRAARSKVESAWLTELARLLPEILQETPTLHPPEPITHSWQRHHLFEAVSRALLAIDQPLVLLIDDLQWCDKETLELLHFLLRHAATLSRAHLMLVGTARLPDEVTTTHPLYELLNPLRGSDTLTQLDLARLNQAETAALARQMVDQPLDDLALQQLFRDTAGNPLFVVETMRATQGHLPRNGSGGGYRAAAIVPIDETEMIIQHLPPKVLAIIQARLGQLSAVARELCAWAAIVGRAFSLDLLVAASQIPQEKAVNALDELWQRRIIREQGSNAYDFSHDRIRDVAAAGVSRVRRIYLHRCMAETLEGYRGKESETVVAQIATHYDAAGVTEKAIEFYEQAAQAARRIYANHQMVAYLQRALHLLIDLPASKERDERELLLLHTLGPALVAINAFNLTRLHEVYERTRHLSQRLGVKPNLALLRISAIHQISLKGLEQTARIGQYLLDIAEQAPLGREPVLYVEANYVLGITAFWQGRFVQSQHYLQQAVGAYSVEFQERHLAEYGLATGIYCRARLAQTLWYLGFPDQARRHIESARMLAHELQHPLTLCVVLAYHAWHACEQGEIGIVEECLQSIRTYAESNSSQIDIITGLLEGWRRLLCGEFMSSIAHLLDYNTARMKWKADSLFGTHALLILAEAYCQAGGYEQGLIVIEQGLIALGDEQNYWCIAAFHHRKGELLLGQGAPLWQVERSFQQAIVIARRQEAKALELRATMSLARLWAQQRKGKEAHALLAEVYHWFTEGFDTPDLQEAQALLAARQQ